MIYSWFQINEELYYAGVWERAAHQSWIQYYIKASLDKFIKSRRVSSRVVNGMMFNTVCAATQAENSASALHRVEWHWVFT